MDRNITLYYGNSKDLDLLFWLKKIHKNGHTQLVKAALRAHIQKQKIDLGSIVVKQNKVPKSVRKSIRLTKGDEDIIDFLSQIGENMICDTIKNILRQYIQFQVVVSQNSYVPFFIPNKGNYTLVKNDRVVEEESERELEGKTKVLVREEKREEKVERSSGARLAKLPVKLHFGDIV